MLCAARPMRELLRVHRMIVRLRAFGRVAAHRIRVVRESGAQSVKTHLTYQPPGTQSVKSGLPSQWRRTQRVKKRLPHPRRRTQSEKTRVPYRCPGMQPAKSRLPYRPPGTESEKTHLPYRPPGTQRAKSGFPYQCVPHSRDPSPCAARLAPARMPTGLYNLALRARASHRCRPCARCAAFCARVPKAAPACLRVCSC